ncbi:uncharacterized protein TM35_000042090 [Trypanosoma theileri]|uniref:Roadblock/LAMTOR2 domain-containing protein n=1 Tax=Trypanosoma theileri TaxID=67003 RepID=A0A1X0P543_9TRYP|nr:uncharacterized protein TM35_000042090 [Trypanosoma theileri]ORC91995.1 hypothetical protein TM35_000042090 [Trypanosoma theileri]
MLDAAAINSSMQQAVEDGVVGVFLLDRDGVLLTSASADPDYVHTKERAMIIAAISNVWRACASNDMAKNKLTNKVETESLEQVLIDFGENKICAMSVGGNAILGLVGSGMEMGLVKLKTATLQRRLDSYLRHVLSTFN